MTGARLGQATGRYVAVIICAAAIIGGGTQQGLLSDHFLQLLLIPAVFLGVCALRGAKLGYLQIALLVAVLLLMAVQFWPVAVEFPAETGLPSMRGFYSQTPQRSVEAALFLVTVLPVFFVVRQMSAKQHAILVQVICFAVVVNLAFAVLKVATGNVPIFGRLLPFDIGAGFFANPNHFAALVYIAIPLAGWLLLYERDRRLGYVFVACVLMLFQLLVGSAAGMAIAATLSVASFFVFAGGFKRMTVRVSLAAMALLCLAALVILARDTSVLDATDRFRFFTTTLVAIVDVFPQGTGLGSFVQVYPSYESVDDIAAEYTNHVHNDYLEIVLETGVLGLVVFVLYALALLRNLPRSGLKKAAFLAIVAVLAHSVVDYPLRTMAIAIVFAVLNGILFSPHEATRRR